MPQAISVFALRFLWVWESWVEASDDGYVGASEEAIANHKYIYIKAVRKLETFTFMNDTKPNKKTEEFTIATRMWR